MDKQSAIFAAELSQANGGLPVPFTLEEFRQDILEVYLHQVRLIAWMSDAESAWRATGVEQEFALGIFHADLSAEDHGLDYDHIRQFPFAQNMEHYYQFGFFGKLDASLETMGDETTHTWAAAIAYDAANGTAAAEWSAYGSGIVRSAQRCLMVAELANARHMLEGGSEWFFHFSSPARKEDAVAIDGLTVRQMALLSGMEEMSIRAAANPKRANPLRTYSEDGRTRIAFDVAKEWLQSKGRYIPITRYWSEGDNLDLASRRFKDLRSLAYALHARLRAIQAKSDDETIACLLAECGFSSAIEMLWADETLFSDPDKMQRLAGALGLPADLLVLRCKETLVIEQLSRIELELKQLQLPTAACKN